MRWALPCLLLASSLLAAPAVDAQDVPGSPLVIAPLETLRARAAARGFLRSEVAAPRPHEVWCAALPCAEGVDRFELYVQAGQLVELQVVDHAAGDGFALGASWQVSGAFTFRFARGDDVVDLTWELTYAPPGMSVGFTERDTAEIVALDPADGAHAFELWIRRELLRYLASESSLRDTAMARRAELRAAVVRGLRTSSAIRVNPSEHCHVERATPYGTGWFDECVYRHATPEEMRAAIATLDLRLARERRLIRAHHRAWFRTLRQTFGAPDP